MAKKKAPAASKPASTKGKKKKGGGKSGVRPVGLVARAEAAPSVGVHGTGGKLGGPRNKDGSLKKGYVDWSPGQELGNQEVAGDGDGNPVDDFVNSQLKPGQTQDQWLSGAVKNMKARGVDAPDMHNSTDVQGWLDGIYAKHGSDSKAASDEIWHDWQKAGATYDSSEQYRSSLYEYKGDKKKERIWDSSQRSWVDADVPVLLYIDPKKFPGLVRNDAPTGSVFEATYKYKDAAGQWQTATAPLMVYDHGTNKAEMTEGAMGDLHIPGTVDKVDAKVSLKYLGQGDVSHLPTRESVRKDYERLKKELGGKHANAQSQGGAFYMSDAPDHGVMSGANHLLVTVADPACMHSGGAPVTTGSNTVFIGPQLAPASGEGDETEDGYLIKEKTGDQTVFIA